MLDVIEKGSFPCLEFGMNTITIYSTPIHFCHYLTARRIEGGIAKLTLSIQMTNISWPDVKWEER